MLRGLTFYSPQPKRHLIKQAEANTNRKKKNSSSPRKTAPIMLVATKAKARITRAETIVPRAPIRRAFRAVHLHLHTAVLSLKQSVPRATARNKTAIPKKTQEKTGAMVMVPVICKNAVITPNATLAITAKKVQEHLLLQPKKLIYSPPTFHYM